MALLTLDNMSRALDADGDTESGALRYVYQAGTTTAVSCYSDASFSSPQSNPLSADAGGIFAATYLPPGTYKVVVKTADEVTLYERDDIVVGSVPTTGYLAGFESLSWLLADDTMGYSDATVIAAEGDIVVAGDYRYVVAASGATDHHVITSNEVKLYVQPGTSGYSPLAFGVVADGGNIATALGACLEAAFAERQAVVKFPPKGEYTLDSLVDVSFPAVGSATQKIVIDGAGCRLEIPASNTTGGIKITKDNLFQHLCIRDLDIVSGAAIGTDASDTNGTALEIVNSTRPGDAGWGTTEYTEVTLDNVHVHSKTPASLGRFDNGIILDGIWYPKLTNCWVNTRHPGTDADTTYESGSGFYFNNCFYPELIGCRSLGRWLYNLRIDEDEDFGYEDFTVLGGFYVGGRDAIAVQMSSAGEQADALKEPGGRILGVHANGHRYGIYMADRLEAEIMGNHIYTTSGTGKYEYAVESFIAIHDCQNISVTGNKLTQGGQYTDDNDTSRGVHLTGVTDGCWISGNQFGHDGIAIYQNSTGTNYARGNLYKAYNAPNNSGPTKLYVQAAGSLIQDEAPRTITPVLDFDGGTTGITYSTQTGSYVRNGNTVTGYVNITLTSKGTDTGDAEISAGLPAPLSGAKYGCTVPFCSGMNQGVQQARIGITGKIELLHYNGTGNSDIITDADFGGTDTLQISFSYQTAVV